MNMLFSKMLNTVVSGLSEGMGGRFLKFCCTTNFVDEAAPYNWSFENTSEGNASDKTKKQTNDPMKKYKKKFMIVLCR